LVEKLITLAKEGSIHSRRQVVKIIRNKSVVHKLFTEIAETFRNTSGGYVRITKTGFRLGDHAELAQIELLQTPKSTAGGEPKRAEPTEENGKPEVETVAEVADGEDGQDAAQSEETEVTSDETSAESDSSPAASDSEARPSPDHKPAQGEN
jgi:large subunit ribosomal protein L17